MTINRKIALFLGATLLSACQPSADDAPRIDDAWARETAPGQKMAAAYLTIANPGREDVRVTGVSTPAAMEASLHRSEVQNGVATMRELEDGLLVEAGESTTLEPGGDHVMLMGLKGPLAQGKTMPLSLTFADGHVETIDVAIVGAGER